MKKYFQIIFAAIFMLSVSAAAQDQTPSGGEGSQGREFRQGGNRPQQTPQMRAQSLAKQLSLPDSVKAKVQAYYEKLDAARAQKQPDQNQKLTREERQAQFEAQRKAQDEELEKILGTEKFKQYQTARAERMKKMQERREN